MADQGAGTGPDLQAPASPLLSRRDSIQKMERTGSGTAMKRKASVTQMATRSAVVDSVLRSGVTDSGLRAPPRPRSALSGAGPAAPAAPERPTTASTFGRGRGSSWFAAPEPPPTDQPDPRDEDPPLPNDHDRTVPSWQVGEHGVVVGAPERLLHSFEQNPQLEWNERLFQCCGKIGQVTDVAVDEKKGEFELYVVLYQSDAPSPGPPAVDADKISFGGRISNEEGAECVASFPGTQVKAWHNVVNGTDELSCACSFLGDEESGLGQHATDPDSPDGGCYCKVLYGDTKWWGCVWFKNWRANIELAVARRQQLLVFFLRGQVGEGKVAWDQLAVQPNLWDQHGLGGSQKGEVAFLDKMVAQGHPEYQYKAIDVGKWIDDAADSGVSQALLHRSAQLVLANDAVKEQRGDDNLKRTKPDHRSNESAKLYEFYIPFSAMRKVKLEPFHKPAFAAAADVGLVLRQTPYGGLQMDLPMDDSNAQAAGLDKYFGWWLTHAGDTRVSTLDQFESIEANDLVFEQRVTLPYEFAYRKLEFKLKNATLMSEFRTYFTFWVVFVIWTGLSLTGLVGGSTGQAFYMTENAIGPVLGNEIPHTFSDSSGIGCNCGCDTCDCDGVEPVTVGAKWEKTYWDLANSGDWQTWVVTMALDSLWNTGPNAGQFGPSMSANIPLGAVRFRTIRMSNDSCSINRDIVPKGLSASNPELQGCYDSYPVRIGEGEAEGSQGESAAYRSHFHQETGRRRDLPPVAPIPPDVYDPTMYTQWSACSDMNPGGRWNPPVLTGQVATYHCGGYYFEIPWYTWNSETKQMEATSGDWAVSKFRERACNDFYDDTATRLVTLEFYEYSPTWDIILSTKLIFEVAAGGAWIPFSQISVFTIWNINTRKAQTTFDIIVLLWVCYFFGDFCHDCSRQYRRAEEREKGSGLAGLAMHVADGWTMIECFNLVLYLVAFGFRFTWWARCEELNVKIDAIQKQGYYPGEFEEIQWLFQMQLYLGFFNLILTFMRMLKYSTLSKRYSIVVDTLADAQASIVGVLIIFCLVWVAFSLTGHILYGAQVFDFRSPSSSLSMLGRMILGEFDFDEMKRENRYLTALFFWGYTWLGVFILFNFVIGVICESFGNVTGQTQVDSLDEVFSQTFKNLRLCCRKSYIQHYLRMRFVKCYTRETLLEKCQDAVDHWRGEAYEQFEDEETGEKSYKEGEEEENQIITRAEFMGAIRGCGDPPGLVLAEIGEEYVAYIWDHLVYEFQRGQEVQSLQEQMKKQAAFQAGCRKALEDKQRIIESFSTRVDDLRVTLVHVKELLTERYTVT